MRVMERNRSKELGYKYVKKKYENQTFRTCQTGNDWQEVREE
jgi:hypothetical protein